MESTRIRQYAMGNKENTNYIEINWKYKYVVGKIVKKVIRWRKNRMMIKRLVAHGKH